MPALRGAILLCSRAGGKSFAASGDGSIAVEFGFILPVILTMLLGIVEASLAISNQLTVQAAARVGTQFGLTKPPVQGNVQPVVDAARAALPQEWTGAGADGPATVAANLACECEFTGPAACGSPCGAGERSQTYLRVVVTKPYRPLVKIRYFSPQFVLKDTSLVRLN